VEEGKDETWQKSLKSFKCEYDYEHVVAELSSELDEAKKKLASMIIANATKSGKDDDPKPTESV
jgi:hypothetical protein